MDAEQLGALTRRQAEAMDEESIGAVARVERILWSAEILGMEKICMPDAPPGQCEELANQAALAMEAVCDPEDPLECFAADRPSTPPTLGGGTDPGDTGGAGIGGENPVGEVEGSGPVIAVVRL